MLRNLVYIPVVSQSGWQQHVLSSSATILSLQCVFAGRN